MTAGGEPRATPRTSRFRLLVVGVGGQGVLSTARCIGDAALLAGENVVVGQLHGMSQRGGTVEATVAIGPGKTSFVADGSAHTLLGLEPLEAVRALRRLAPAAGVVVSTGRIAPPTLALAGASYPDLAELLAQVRRAAAQTCSLDGSALAAAAGDPRALGAVMLGAAWGAGALPLLRDALSRAIERRAPRAARSIAARAFELGVEAASREIRPPHRGGGRIECTTLTRPSAQT